MPAYAIARLRPPRTLHEEVLTYMERIQSTLDPFDGRFLVHGAPAREVLEGDWPEALVIIGFPSLVHARDWYASEAYQALLPLRTRHMDGDVLLIDGLAPDYDPATTAAALRLAQLP
ncbi:MULTISPECIES: DUF1330 domain-containing protein [Streptomyces]|uniref:DUF1330 domain-containing protein n=2 Tax=Streptomyces TaxID=1883 RepID=A0A117IWY4_9ACTN|nr:MULTISPECIES: DUF1330 domain-containing protein [Streptomyces]KUH39247.1 hypothetical protein ATE80_08240 [Streptomyces kanasensis]UUS32694.1 DUF1330 domain-containing protein [Streptomyces changanensis]